jgi:hypothetical protein
MLATSETGSTGMTRPMASISRGDDSHLVASLRVTPVHGKCTPRSRAWARIENGVPKFTQA